MDVDRRKALVALAGLGLTGGSVWAVRNGLPSGGAQDDALPVRVETLEAPGSEAGSAIVPHPDKPTVVDLFATWCAPCKEQMEPLGVVRDEYSDRVAFVSVTNEMVGRGLTRDDIREWWRSHGGGWTVGLDPESDLMSALGASGLPYLVVTDASGEVRWGHGGVADASTLRNRVQRVLDGA